MVESIAHESGREWSDANNNDGKMNLSDLTGAQDHFVWTGSFFIAIGLHM
jgi:hypothetical protein